MATTRIHDRAGDELEERVAEALDRSLNEGELGVEAVCRAHPAYADEIRARVASLSRTGLWNPPARGDLPGAFGRYRVLRELGRGGMGVVYLAEDERLGRRVALKASAPRWLATDRARARFDREVRAAAQLRHPGIVPIFDVGEDQGVLYYTMQYVEGATLAAIVGSLRGVPFSDLTSAHVRTLASAGATAAHAPKSTSSAWGRTYVETVCRIVIDVAEALEHAHVHGVVHRDVKPANILVDADGRAQLFDLGLAHLADDPAITGQGDFAGTPQYVAPEQVSARSEDPRTDVYSLGATLYELLALRPPFSGKTTQAVLRQVVTKEPPLLRRIHREVPRDLETICLTALEKDPARRYKRAADLAADLRRFLEFRPVEARPIGAARRTVRFLRRNPALGTALALGVFVVIGVPAGLLWANAQIREQRDRASASARTTEQVTEFLVTLFRPPADDVEHAGEMSARAILDRGAGSADRALDTDPLVRAAVLESLGRAYAHQGEREPALRLFNRALAVRQQEQGEAHVDVARLLATLSDVHLAQGNTAVAEALARRSARAFAACGEGDSLLAAAGARTLSRALLARGERGEARAALERAAAIQRRSARADGDELADTLHAWAEVELAGSSPADLVHAETLYREELALRRSSWQPAPAAIADAHASLARCLERLGRISDAREQRAHEAGLRERLALDLRAAQRAREDRSAPTPYSVHFQNGISALQSGRYPDAIAAFEQCWQLQPREPIAAYNLACAHALLGDVEAAFTWLERAIDLGYGLRPNDLRSASKDADLARLRDDAEHARRFERLLERMVARSSAALQYASNPQAYVPTRLTGVAAWPVLIVLHADGSTKDAVVNGVWRTVADELGCVLLAPSAPRPVGYVPSEGMEWSFDDEIDGLDRPVVEALRDLKQRYELDRERIFIAGEARGGDIALELARRAPGLYRGVLAAPGVRGASEGSTAPELTSESDGGTPARVIPSLPAEPAAAATVLVRALRELW